MTTQAWSGFWGDGVASPLATYALLVNKNPRRNGIRRTMNREGFRAVTELFDTLIGAASGGAALASHGRVSAVDHAVSSDFGVSGGGQRVIDTVSDINRVSTAADITALKELVFNVTTRPSYVADLSKNGGPAFT